MYSVAVDSLAGPNEDFAAVAAAGFTFVADPYWFVSASSASTLLSVSERYGIQGVPGLSRERLNDAASQGSYLDEYIPAIRSHPALLFYYLGEEFRTDPSPLNTYMTIANAESAYQKLRALDPNHPVVLCHYRFPTGYERAYDVYWYDGYPVRDSPRSMARYAQDFGNLVRGAKEQGKSAWAIVQAFGSVVGDSVYDDPTDVEERAMTFLSIIRGGQGIVFYKHGTSAQSEWYYIARPDRSAHWTYVKKLAAELSASPFLAAATSSRAVVADSPDVETLLTEYGERLYLIAANTASTGTLLPCTLDAARSCHYQGAALQGVHVAISGLGTAQVKVIGEAGIGSGAPGRVLAVAAGGFSDDFDPYAVHVYEITPCD